MLLTHLGSHSIEMAGSGCLQCHRSLASLAGSQPLVEGACQLCIWNYVGGHV